MGADTDLLAGAAWSCGAAAPGSLAGPDDPGAADVAWFDAPVPGTVASAVRAVDGREIGAEELDGQDWWYRVRFAGPASPRSGGWMLHLGGLATLADVWLNGRHVLASESMFTPRDVAVDDLAADNELVIRFAALSPVLQRRRPRPRWKVAGLASQNLRWFRTTLLGRQTGWAETPPPVGPWRPVTLRPVGAVELRASRVVAHCTPVSGGPRSGTVAVTLEVSGPAVAAGAGPVEAVLEVDGRTAPLVATGDDGVLALSGEVRLDDPDLWWPHTHGDQALHAVRAVVAGVTLDLGEVGFRTVEVDRADGGFQVSVNGVPVFCRGACWYPVDPVGFQTSDPELERSIALVRAAGMNMLRIPGGTVYEDDRFFRACDRAGILVWQDLMLGPADPPADDAFVDIVCAEVIDLLDRRARHPSLAVLCGGQQLEEQPAMFGLSRDRWHVPLVHDVLPGLVSAVVPGLPFVSSSPSGGDLPFEPDSGVCHYYGVGVCLLPLDDLRRADPRFVTEGLAFSIPPERSARDEEAAAGLSSRKERDGRRAVHRDPGSSFDLEDVRDQYVAALFAVDVAELWRTDPGRALDLGRAATAEILGTAVAEWRRPGSSCAGMLSIAFRDLRPGPGWGLVDAAGHPKAPWYVLARGWAPVAVTMTDERMNGLDVHLFNDTGEVLVGALRIGLHTRSHTVETASGAVTVPARGACSVRADSMVEGFRDLSYAYRFGPRPFELITADLVGPSDQVLAHGAFLPGGPGRTIEPDVGLQARMERVDGGRWRIHISTREFAQYVHVDVPGFVASDSWLHLPPGGERDVLLHPSPGAAAVPTGTVRALNSTAVARVSA